MNWDQTNPPPYPLQYPNQPNPNGNQPGCPSSNEYNCGPQPGAPPFWGGNPTGPTSGGTYSREFSGAYPNYPQGQFSAQQVNWVPCNGSNAPPPNAVGMKSGIYVIRGRHGGDTIPGKWVLKNHRAYIPYGGREIEIDNFEVLCIPKERYCWTKARQGVVPQHAVHAGVTSTGEELYVAKGVINDEKCIGKIHPSHKCAYYPWGGKEHRVEKYKVLCSS
ncbi:unnamed protein product [Calicophoron daubneyi]|uniref:Uncharacterized protein n=1 Tax=Calicophoron daubneyi TaxID=300641 RepID=A0AAV2TWL7_CALDB